ncbi:hypothetical protein [Kouleothrix sp.]|uniref:hypothetical protein n=1 Tax=Kouleothrix sp. TaxID=2779161 RepID=UPI00391DBCBB
MKANIAVQPVENLSKENQVAEEKPILTLEQAINAITSIYLSKKIVGINIMAMYMRGTDWKL